MEAGKRSRRSTRTSICNQETEDLKSSQESPRKKSKGVEKLLKEAKTLPEKSSPGKQKVTPNKPSKINDSDKEETKKKSPILASVVKSTPTTSGKKRGRPKKNDSACTLIQTKLNLSPEGWNNPAKKTSKQTTSSQSTPAVQIEETVSKRGRVRKTIVYEDAISVSSDSKSEEEVISEDDFNPDNIPSEEEEEEESISSSLVSEKDSIKSIELESDGSVCDIIIDKPSRRTPRKGIMAKSEKQKDSSLLESTPNLVDKFNADEVIEAWSYELDQETKMFTRPIIPMLSDTAVKPFLSKNSKPKCVIYNCPFCERIFTYTLVFKNHLYSCEKNTNVPDYVLYCCKHPECAYKGSKKQEMVNHFFKLHDIDKDTNRSPNDSVNSASKRLQDVTYTDFYPQMTKTKQNQLEVSRYYYIEKPEFTFTFDYFNKSIAKNYRRLKLLNELYLKKSQPGFMHYLVNINKPDTAVNLNLRNEMNLKFQLPNESQSEEEEEVLELKPFEVYTTISRACDSFRIINAVNHITTMDWCPTRLKNTKLQDQYLSFASCPLKQINDIFGVELESILQLSENRVKDLFQCANLIYIVRFPDLNGIGSDQDNKAELFGLLNRTIGHVNSLKWRPDCGASVSDTVDDITGSNFESTFIGYLLSASSNGNGYISCVQDMTKVSSFAQASSVRSLEHGTVTALDSLNVYEAKSHIILSTNSVYGQCTSCDWSQLNGATDIALGYANGTVALFQVNSSTLKDQLKLNQTSPLCDEKNQTDLFIHPIRTFDTQQSFINALKWSKLNSSVLASGALFSRDLKCWDIKNTHKPFIEYEIFVTEFAFTLHSNDLFIVKESKLKGENHLFELDMSFNVFNKEKDENRAHSSLFYTEGSMNSIDQSDYLNKFIVCDSHGHVIVSSANNPKYWIAKHQLMFNSFSQVCEFQLLDTVKMENYDEYQNYRFNPKNKMTKTIRIDMNRKINDKKSSKTKSEQDSTVNSNYVDLNTLTVVRFNSNYNFLNWYSVGSHSGFVFLQRLDEIITSLDD